MLNHIERGRREKSLKCAGRPRKGERRLIGAWISRDEPGRPRRQRRRQNSIQGTIRGIAHNISERGRTDRGDVVVDPEGAANGCLPSSCGVICEPDSRTEVLERGVSQIGFRCERIGPTGVANYVNLSAGIQQGRLKPLGFNRCRVEFIAQS